MANNLTTKQAGMTQEEIEKYALLLANNAKKLDYGRDIESGRGWWSDRNAIAYNAANKMAKKILSSFPQWISVEDRLPKGNVIVIDAYGEINVAFYGESIEGFWLSCDGTSEIIADVTHWMPLPETPTK